MSKSVIVVASPLPEALTQGLCQFGEVQVLDGDSSFPSDSKIFIATAVNPVPANLIEQFPNDLKLIANIGVGTDNIDIEAASARGIAVSNTPVVTEDTADLCMALMLATCRRLGECERHLRNDDWTAGAGLLGKRIHGATLGIVGFGAIGQAVARRARGFGMTILYHGPNRKPDAEAELDARYCFQLDELLAEADIISLNCGLSKGTHHLLNSSTLAKVKADAVIINTGRGPLIDERAMVEALASGRLAGAGLDVFEFEPLVTQELLSFDNVTLLPHIGSATGECRMDMALRLFANIKSFLSTGTPLDPCN